MTSYAQSAISTGQAHAMLSQLALRLEAGESVLGALPGAFLAAGIDPYDAVDLLATHRRAALSVLLADILPAEALARIAKGEREADIVGGLRHAARALPLTSLR